MLASEIMTTDVATVGPDAPIAELVALLVARGISAVPVVSGGRLVGIVSEGDLLRRAELGTGRKRSRWLEIATPGDRLAAEYVHEHGRKVADVMTPDVVTVPHDTPVSEVADLLERRRIKRVPVLRDGKLVGIVSRANLVQALALHRDAKPAAAVPTDLEVRTAILQELGRHQMGRLPPGCERHRPRRDGARLRRPALGGGTPCHAGCDREHAGGGRGQGPPGLSAAQAAVLARSARPERPTHRPYGTSTSAPVTSPARSRRSASLASASGSASTVVRTGTSGASARNASPSRRVRFATERTLRSCHSKS